MIRFVLPIAQDLLSDFALYKGIYKSRKAYSTGLCGVKKKVLLQIVWVTLTGLSQ
jgi:hypothetical protein